MMPLPDDLYDDEYGHEPPRRLTYAEQMIFLKASAEAVAKMIVDHGETPMIIID